MHASSAERVCAALYAAGSWATGALLRDHLRTARDCRGQPWWPASACSAAAICVGGLQILCSASGVRVTAASPRRSGCGRTGAREPGEPCEVEIGRHVW